LPGSGGVEGVMNLISLAVDGVAGFSREIVKFVAITGVISVILIFLH
jgi:hypothetical protein